MDNLLITFFLVVAVNLTTGYVVTKDMLKKGTFRWRPQQPQQKPTQQSGENIGWKTFFEENPTEFHDLPLTWENTKFRVPDWINGTFIRNGAAQISFGSDKRILSSWLDGFAKLHKFKFNDGKVLFSGKMLEPPNYLDSVKKGELTPQMTLNRFNTKAEEWTFLEKMKISEKTLMKTSFDNNNPALWRIGPKNPEKGIYMAVTDAPIPMRFNITDLSSMGLLYPPTFPMTMTGCAHYQREIGTDNSLNLYMRIDMHGRQFAELMRWRPQDSYQTPQTVAKWFPKKMSYIHSFSITENYAIVFFYPVGVDATKFFSSGFHIMETLGQFPNDKLTDIYTVHLKTGEVTEFPNNPDIRFAIHTANAYEMDEQRIRIDLVTNNYANLRDFARLDKMLNPPPYTNDSSNDEVLMHHILHLGDGTVGSFARADSRPIHRFVHHFDFPIINELYRGKKYCIVYGWSEYTYSYQVLTKKNMCDDSEDKTWYTPNHYSGEMYFIGNPENKSEDDGILITIVYDGPKEQSYLLMLDANSFTELNRAYLPVNIPMSFHGMYYPEA